MYRVHCIEGDRWRIVDGNDRLVFVGTKQQGEDWLDFQENARPRPAVVKARTHGFLESWLRPLGRLVSNPAARASQ